MISLFWGERDGRRDFSITQLDIMSTRNVTNYKNFFFFLLLRFFSFILDVFVLTILHDTKGKCPFESSVVPSSVWASCLRFRSIYSGYKHMPRSNLPGPSLQSTSSLPTSIRPATPLTPPLT